ncbi:hypothetical protein [Actinoplanes sp. NPDC051851]|uniref:hypothetical protein n=1 Tax=Actinoplanes sp. NPDC051851 TaxID=3154753 RepID=UPI003415F2A0
MTQPDVHAPLAQEMADRGRAVAPEGFERARRVLQAAAKRRDPAVRAAAIERLRRPAAA